MNYSDFSYEQLISTLVEQRGYTPYIEFGDATPGCIRSANFAIIKPSKIGGKDGVSRYRLTSEIRFKLVKNDSTRSMEARLDLLRQMKCDAVELVCDLELSPYVVAMTKLSIESKPESKTALNEVVVEVSVVLISAFNRDSVAVC